MEAENTGPLETFTSSGNHYHFQIRFLNFRGSLIFGGVYYSIGIPGTATFSYFDTIEINQPCIGKYLFVPWIQKREWKILIAIIGNKYGNTSLNRPCSTAVLVDRCKNYQPKVELVEIWLME